MLEFSCTQVNKQMTIFIIIVMHVPILNLLNVVAFDVIFTIDHKMYPLNKLAAKMIGFKSVKSIF